MTTDANAPAAQVPTMGEIDEILKGIGLDWPDHETAFLDPYEIVRARNAIIALYAPANAPTAQDMTTDLTHPENVSALPEKVNTTGPTREAFGKAMAETLEVHDTGWIDTSRAYDAIIALYAPALVRLERERDEARADYERVLNVGAKLIDDIARIDIERATAEAEGMRKAAGMLNERAVRAKEQADIERTKDAMMRGDVAAYTLQKAAAAILAAIPK
jgi:hypothetical protein